MTNIMTKPIKRISNRIKDKLYDTARALTRVAYTIIPTATYIATSEKINEIENQLNDYSAKGMGIAGGLLLGHCIDRVTGRMLPNSPNFRKLSQIAGYFSLANLANLIKNRTENLQEMTLETVLSNVRGTLNHATETLMNLSQLNQSSDLDYITSAGIMALTGMAALKLGDSFIRSSLARTAHNIINSMYNYTMGSEDDAYKHRLANKILIKKAKKEIEDSRLA